MVPTPKQLAKIAKAAKLLGNSLRTLADQMHHGNLMFSFKLPHGVEVIDCCRHYDGRDVDPVLDSDAWKEKSGGFKYIESRTSCVFSINGDEYQAVVMTRVCTPPEFKMHTRANRDIKLDMISTVNFFSKKHGDIMNVDKCWREERNHNWTPEIRNIRTAFEFAPRKIAAGEYYDTILNRTYPTFVQSHNLTVVQSHNLTVVHGSFDANGSFGSFE